MLWEALGGFGEALGRLWEALGGFGREEKEDEKQLYINIL